MSCIFCKILNKEIPSDIIYEDNDIMIFKDIRPKAPVHLLIVPKKHIESVGQLEDSDKELVSKLIYTARDIAKDKGLIGYGLSFNVGRVWGQEIDHLHLHLMGK